MRDFVTLLKETVPTGEENAIHMEALADQLHVTSMRLKKEIKSARRDGVMICSSRKGYFFPNKREEMARFYTTQKRHAASLFKTLRAFKAYMNECEGQMVLSEGGVTDHVKKE